MGSDVACGTLAWCVCGGAEQGASADLASLKQLAAAVLPCVSDRYYKLSAEAVRVLEQLIAVVRPAPDAGAAPANLSALPMANVFSALQVRTRTRALGAVPLGARLRRRPGRPPEGVSAAVEVE